LAPSWCRISASFRSVMVYRSSSYGSTHWYSWCLFLCVYYSLTMEIGGVLSCRLNTYFLVPMVYALQGIVCCHYIVAKSLYVVLFGQGP
jgi:hypothetical protein